MALSLDTDDDCLGLSPHRDSDDAMNSVHQAAQQYSAPELVAVGQQQRLHHVLLAAIAVHVVEMARPLQLAEARVPGAEAAQVAVQLVQGVEAPNRHSAGLPKRRLAERLVPLPAQQ